MERTLDEIEKEIETRKNEVAKIEEPSETLKMLETQKHEILKGEEARQIGAKIATEDIKSDFAKKASDIRKRNAEIAKQEFDNETSELRLRHLKAELQLEHKYAMETLQKDAKHKQMLDKRKKLVAKYGYLYSQNDLATAYDSDGNEYKVPKDFSYSETVNKFRQFGRNVSKLDKPLLQTLKWGLIIAGIVLGVFILKWTKVI